jgi:hypothetical protein
MRRLGLIPVDAPGARHYTARNLAAWAADFISHPVVFAGFPRFRVT